MIRTYKGTSKTWYLNLRALNILNTIHESQIEPLDKKAVNLNLIQNLAASIEGAVRSLIYHHIESFNFYKKAKSTNEKQLVNLIDLSLDQLHYKGFDQLTKYAKRALNIDFKVIYDQDFAIIRSLFWLRNVVAHGGMFENKIDRFPTVNETNELEELEIIYDNNINLTNYLLSKKLIPDNFIERMFEWSYLSDDIKNHFYEPGIEFLNIIYNAYLKKYPSNKNAIYDFQTFRAIIFDIEMNLFKGEEE